MIKAVVFDLDDTLISERDYIESGFKFIASMIANKYDFKKEKVYNIMQSKFEKSSENVFNRTLDALEISYDMNYIKLLINSYRKHLPKISLYNDAKKILDYLYAKEIKLGIITDGYGSAQRNKLKVLDINDYFNHIVVTDELGREYWKPNRKPYEIMKAQLSVDYNNIIYVGDNETKDFITANKLGFITIVIKRKEGIYYNKKADDKYKAQYEINNLEELQQFI